MEDKARSAGDVKRCLRCKRYLEKELFQPPVRICLVCYSRIPDNQGLSLEELKQKAAKSRWARSVTGKQEWQRSYKELAAGTPVKIHLDLDLIEDSLSDYIPNAINCDMCKEPTHHQAQMNIQGNLQWICVKCYLLIHPERKGCFQVDEECREDDDLEKFFAPSKHEPNLANVPDYLLNALGITKPPK